MYTVDMEKNILTPDDINNRINDKIGNETRFDFISDWNAFGNVLLPWCKHQEWWKSFLDFTWNREFGLGDKKFTVHYYRVGIPLTYMEPGPFCSILIEFMDIIEFSLKETIAVRDDDKEIVKTAIKDDANINGLLGTLFETRNSSK